MKKYLSIFWLCLKTTWWKILIVFAAVIAVDLFMYDRMVISAIKAGESISFKQGLELAAMEFCWLWGIRAIFLIFRFNGYKGREQERYAIQRLRINENTFIFLNELFYLFVALLFWALQIGIIYVIGKWHLSAMGKEMYPSFTNALNSSEFAQGILPFEHFGRIIRTVVIFYALSAGCSEGARQDRYGQHGRSGIIFGAVVYYLVNCLQHPSGVHMGWNPLTTDPLFIILALVYLVFTKLRMYREEE